MPKVNNKGIVNIFVVLILIVGLIFTVYLVKKPTNILPKAYESNPDKTVDNLKNINIMSNGKFGVAINIGARYLIPNGDQFLALAPGWVRFIYQPQYRIPDFPQGVKTLVVFNQESVPGKPDEAELLQWKDNQGTDVYQEEALSKWRTYVDEHIASLEDFIKEYQGKVDAIQIWNEEDLCNFNYKTNPPTAGYCPKVPEPIYAEMLKRSAEVIKKYSPNTKVIMGGLAKGDIFWGDGGYLVRIQKIEPAVFNQVDAVGLHPYFASFNNWCNSDYIDSSTDQEECQLILPYGNLQENVQKYKAALPTHVKLWITEIGIGSGEERFDEWQKEYMKNIFDYLQNQAEVIIWYGWIDFMLGGNGETELERNMGLYDGYGKVKPSGELFKTYSENLQ